MNRPVLPVLALLATLSLLIANPADAAPPPPNYVEAKLGGYFPMAGDVDSFDSGFNGEVTFGRYLAPGFAVEGGLGYFETKGRSPDSSGGSEVQGHAPHIQHPRGRPLRAVRGVRDGGPRGLLREGRGFRPGLRRIVGHVGQLRGPGAPPGSRRPVPRDETTCSLAWKGNIFGSTTTTFGVDTRLDGAIRDGEHRVPVLTEIRRPRQPRRETTRDEKMLFPC